MRTLTIATFSVLIASGLCTSAVTQSPPLKRERLCFIDEGVKDPSLIAFRSTLREIVDQKDAKGLINVLAENIHVGLDERPGISNFVQIHTPDDPSSEIWRDLGRILDLGGSFVGPNVFCAPFVRCPGAKAIDSELFVVVLGAKVPAHASPTSTSEVIEWLSCDVLPFDGSHLPEKPSTSAPGWLAVYLGKRWGFVEEEQTRMVGDWYFHVTKIENRWLLTTFLAG
jgi:hypothetical protein